MCCIGGTVEEITPLIKNCLNIGTENCVARCKRLVQQDNAAATVSEIHLATCPRNR